MSFSFLVFLIWELMNEVVEEAKRPSCTRRRYNNFGTRRRVACSNQATKKRRRRSNSLYFPRKKKKGCMEEEKAAAQVYLLTKPRRRGGAKEQKRLFKKAAWKDRGICQRFNSECHLYADTLSGNDSQKTTLREGRKDVEFRTGDPALSPWLCEKGWLVGVEEEREKRG